LLDGGGRLADPRHRLAQLLFTAAELFAPPLHFACVVDVDATAVGGQGFEYVCHSLGLRVWFL
jgi:hypothetical protein